MNQTAIVFVHKGNHSYFDLVVKYTRQSNKDSNIVILGDETNECVALKYNCQHEMYEKYLESWEYKHISVNTVEYEKFCFERWIIIKNWLLNHTEVQHVVYSDSDNILLQDISLINDEMKTYDVLSFIESVVVPNILIIKRDVMINLGNKIIEFYKKPFKEIQEFVYDKVNNHSHFSDMYLLFIIVSSEISSENIYHLENNERFTFNANINNIVDILKVVHNEFYVNDKLLFNIHFCHKNKESIQETMKLVNL